MQLDRGMVCTDRWSDGLPMIPDGPNILTQKSAGTNDKPRYPLHRPVTGDPSWTRLGSKINLLLCLLSWHLRQCHNRHKHSITCVKIPPIYALVIQSKRCFRNRQFHAAHHFRLDFTHFFWLDSTDCFQLDPTRGFRLYLTQFFQFDSTHVSRIYL